MEVDLAKQKRALHDYWVTEGIITDDTLLNAFMKVPRENFVLDKDMYSAYGDHPLPILSSQTISQPTTVMMMTQALDLKPGHKVLEIGSGSGYQSAIISELISPGGQLTTIEYDYDLAIMAKRNLSKAGYSSVKVLNSDGGEGNATGAPYDRIIVTCACPQMLKPLKEQLAVGGRMIIPISKMIYDEMVILHRTAEGYYSDSMGSFSFVPLKGKYAQKEIDMQRVILGL